MAVLLLMVAMLWPVVTSADCIPVAQVREHIGEDRCVTGKVFRVRHGVRGVTLFDFCEDFRVCPFSVVIFPGHLKDIGDVRQLENRVIEIHGPLKEYDGRAEIVLDELRQLGGEAVRIPRLPKNYDVENRGHYSAGKFSLPRAKHAASKKRQTPKLPIEITNEGEDPVSAPGRNPSSPP